MPYPNLTLLDEKSFDEWTVVCNSDQECPNPSANKHCVDFYWDMVVEPQARTGSSYQQG